MQIYIIIAAALFPVFYAGLSQLWNRIDRGFSDIEARQLAAERHARRAALADRHWNRPPAAVRID